MATDPVALSVAELLDRVGARTPTPGGGCVAALNGALAAALGQMVARYSIRQRTPEDDNVVVRPLLEELQRAETMLRRLAGEDVEAYEAYREAGAAGSGEAKDTAVRLATSVPLEVAAVCVGVLGNLADLGARANRRLLSDLGVAAAIAEAAVQAAGYLVRGNAGDLATDQWRAGVLSQLAALRGQAGERRGRIEELIAARMQDR